MEPAEPDCAPRAERRRTAADSDSGARVCGFRGWGRPRRAHRGHDVLRGFDADADELHARGPPARCAGRGRVGRGHEREQRGDVHRHGTCCRGDGDRCAGRAGEAGRCRGHGGRGGLVRGGERGRWTARAPDSGAAGLLHARGGARTARWVRSLPALGGDRRRCSELAGGAVRDRGDDHARSAGRVRRAAGAGARFARDTGVRGVGRPGRRPGAGRRGHDAAGAVRAARRSDGATRHGG